MKKGFNSTNFNMFMILLVFFSVAISVISSFILVLGLLLDFLDFPKIRILFISSIVCAGIGATLLEFTKKQ